MTYSALKETFPNASKKFLLSNATDAPRKVRGVNQRRPVKNPAVDAAPPPAVVKPTHPLPLDNTASVEGRGPERTTHRTKLHFTLFRVSLLDPDSKYASIKFLLDALRQAGLIPDDKESDIELIVTQTRVKKYALEGTGVEIVYPKT